MRIVGCDLHASQQTIAMLDRDTGEISERITKHEGTAVRDFYAGLAPPILVGIEATGSMGWFLRVMEELGITCRVGDPARIRAVETRRQKHDRRDARLLLTLLTEERFPAIWMPSAELRDLRALLRHRDQWVRMRTRVKNALQGGWRLRTAFDAARACGVATARRCWRLCRFRSTRVPAGQSCKRSTPTSPRTSRRWIGTSRPKRTSDRRPAAS